MRLIAAAVAAFLCLGAAAQPLPPAPPESAGFSAEGLSRIDRFFQREIAAKRVPGTAAPGDLRKYYREQVDDLVYGAMDKSYIPAGERLGR